MCRGCNSLMCILRSCCSDVALPFAEAGALDRLLDLPAEPPQKTSSGPESLLGTFAVCCNLKSNLKIMDNLRPIYAESAIPGLFALMLGWYHLRFFFGNNFEWQNKE
uniref:Galanin-related peptide n=1 Tax=Homo sapiens TaxID=9606 RepID=Q9Y2S1_HUMAN|nr:galanin-related peptide [Homo sapiens]